MDFVDLEDEIHASLVRESGAIRRSAGVQAWAATAEESCEAAGPAAAPHGEPLWSDQNAGRWHAGCRSLSSASSRPADQPGCQRIVDTASDLLRHVRGSLSSTAC